MGKPSETIEYARFLVEHGNTVVGINLVGELLEIINRHDGEKAEAWDEGFTSAWYEALPYEDARDASESKTQNPYRKESPNA